MAISTVVHFLHLMKWKMNLKSEKRFSQITQNVEKVQTKSILYSIENNGWILRKKVALISLDRTLRPFSRQRYFFVKKSFDELLTYFNWSLFFNQSKTMNSLFLKLNNSFDAKKNFIKNEITFFYQMFWLKIFVRAKKGKSIEWNKSESGVGEQVSKWVSEIWLWLMESPPHGSTFAFN